MFGLSPSGCDEVASLAIFADNNKFVPGPAKMVQVGTKYIHS